MPLSSAAPAQDRERAQYAADIALEKVRGIADNIRIHIHQHFERASLPG